MTSFLECVSDAVNLVKEQGDPGLVAYLKAFKASSPSTSLPHRGKTELDNLVTISPMREYFTVFDLSRKKALSAIYLNHFRFSPSEYRAAIPGVQQGSGVFIEDPNFVDRIAREIEQILRTCHS